MSDETILNDRLFFFVTFT